MPPQAIEVALFALKEIATHAPTVFAEVKELLSKPDPTDADWDALFAKAQGKSYEDYIAEAKARKP